MFDGKKLRHGRHCLGVLLGLQRSSLFQSDCRATGGCHLLLIGDRLLALFTQSYGI